MWFSDLFLAAEEPFVEMKAQYIKQMEWSSLGRGEAPPAGPLICPTLPMALLGLV